jgi:hypothetical protein
VLNDLKIKKKPVLLWTRLFPDATAGSSNGKRPSVGSLRGTVTERAA